MTESGEPHNRSQEEKSEADDSEGFELRKAILGALSSREKEHKNKRAKET